MSIKPHLINNTENWITLCGKVTPTSCGSSIIIGNFNTDDETFIYSNGNSSGGPFAYYFIDDVKLFKLDTNKTCINPCFNATINIDNDTAKAKPISFKPVSIQYQTSATTPQLTNNKWVQNLKDILEKNPLAIILIEGHTDNVGSEQSNKNLSKLRAQKMYQLLIDKGISEKNISYKYFGSAQPKANNLSAKNRELNRRVQISVIP